MTGKSLHGAPRVLVVDDHELSREYTAAALRTSGAAVKQSADAAQALKIAAEWQPQLVLLDVQLPGVGGPALARQMRDGWPAGCEQPRIVLISAARLPDRWRDRSEAVVDGFLRKPVPPEALRKWVTASPGGSLRECRPDTVDRGLRILFRRELRRRIDEVDRQLDRLDLAGAAAILHQLIASSALCQEQSLERRLRALYRCCRQGAAEPALAAAYFDLRKSAAACLDRAEHAGRYSG